MRDEIAIALFASFLLVPVAIYIAGKFSPRISSISYKLMGAICLATAFAFFSFVGWYFLETGQLVSPGKYVPSRIIHPSDSLGLRIFVGGFNIAVGSLLAFLGVTMLRLKPSPVRPASEA